AAPSYRPLWTAGARPDDRPMWTARWRLRRIIARSIGRKDRWARHSRAWAHRSLSTVDVHSGRRLLLRLLGGRRLLGGGLRGRLCLGGGRLLGRRGALGRGGLLRGGLGGA